MSNKTTRFRTDLSNISLVQNRDYYAVYDDLIMIHGGYRPIDGVFYRNVLKKMVKKGYEPISDGRTTRFIPASAVMDGV